MSYKWTDEKPTEPGVPYLYYDGTLHMLILSRLEGGDLLSIDMMDAVENLNGMWSSTPMSLPEEAMKEHPMIFSERGKP